VSLLNHTKLSPARKHILVAEMSSLKSFHTLLIRTGIVSGLLTLSLACVTWNRGEKSAEGASGGTAGESVVSQIGDKGATISRRSRSYWLAQRDSKDLMARTKGALATGDADAAEGFARAYLAKHPGDAEGFAMLASALMLGRKYELAAYYAAEAERLQPGKSRILNIKGLANALGTQRTIHDYQGSLALFKQAFESDERNIAAGLNLGSLYLEMGNPTAAAEVYNKVSERCGQCIPAQMGLGVSLARTKRYNDSVQAFDSVLKRIPDHSGALYHLAVVYKNGLKNPKKAEGYLYAILQSKGERNAAVRERANTLLRAIKGEADPSDRVLASDDQDEKRPDQNKVNTSGTAGDKSAAPVDDGELLMSGAEME
jgi:predicted Zn-dependent protease